MLLPVPGVLKPDELAFVRAALQRARFVDGKLSAGSAAGRVKNNEELEAGAPDLERLNRLAREAPANRSRRAGDRASECGVPEPHSHVD